MFFEQEFPEKGLTGALLDRLTHRVHIVEATGTSYRLRHSQKRAEDQN
jgi:DNA replication protein DnaC